MVAFRLFGSFQRGKLFRSGDPRNAVWRQVERMGTVDNLTRIANEFGHTGADARDASLRIRQAVEMRKASQGASPLTRPLLLYYSALNLVRGVLMTRLGRKGIPSHGLGYKGADDLLMCGARATKGGGTFGELTEAVGPPVAAYHDKLLTLRDVLATIPEISEEFETLKVGASSTAIVAVEAINHGPMMLRYRLKDINKSDFAAHWQEYFPWLKDSCEYLEAFTLKFKTNPKDEGEVASHCEKYLLHDLQWREDAIWYDQVAGNGITLFPRLPAYLCALFILSNICRYEPEKMERATREPTDLAYLLNTFLDHAERYMPQLILEAQYGSGMYFR